MERINLQLHLLQVVYRLREDTDSIVTTVQDWLNNVETTDQHRDLFSKSPFARKIVDDLQFMLGDMAFTLKLCVEDNQHFQAIDTITKNRSESEHGDTGSSCRTLDCCVTELKNLEQAAQTATQMLMDIFERYFFQLPSLSLTNIPHEAIMDLSRLWRDLSTDLYWLERLLGDVEFVRNTMNALDYERV